MNEFAPFHYVKLLEAVLDEILYGLYIMVGHLFYFLDLGGIFRSHVPVDVPQCLEEGSVEVGKLRKRNPAEGDEVLDLHTHPVSDERIFAEIFS